MGVAGGWGVGWGRMDHSIIKKSFKKNMSGLLGVPSMSVSGSKKSRLKTI